MVAIGKPVLRAATCLLKPQALTSSPEYSGLKNGVKTILSIVLIPYRLRFFLPIS